MRSTVVTSSLVLMLVGLLAAGCDGGGTEGDAVLVVEGFFEPDRVPPSITVRRTGALDVPYDPDNASLVGDAEVALTVDGRTVGYTPSVGKRGGYEPVPEQADTLRAGNAFDLEVRWRDARARASGVIPPALRIDSAAVMVPDAPVTAVLLDSLGGPSEEVFVYLVEVTLWWEGPAESDSLFWVRTQLRSEAALSSGVVDFFLRTEEIQRERSVGVGLHGWRSWTGVYAVPVVTESSPLPNHRLRAALLRSTEAYARFASSRDVPERREPVTNVEGGLGLIVGMAVDTLWLDVGPQYASLRNAEPAAP